MRIFTCKATHTITLCNAVTLTKRIFCEIPFCGSSLFYEPKKKVHTKKFFNNFFFQATINLTINLQVIISRKFDSRKYKKILKD